MSNTRTLLLIAVTLRFFVTPAFGQVKIARVSGAPGSFTSATGLAFQSSGNVGYISNPGSGLVQKFRVTTGEILASVQLAPGIGAMALSYDERTLAVLGVSTQKLYLINPATMAVRNEGSYSPSGFTARNNVLFSQDNSIVFVSDASRNQVAAFQSSDATIFRFLAVGINPSTMVALPDPRLIALVCSGKRAGDEESFYFIDTLAVAVKDIRFLVESNAEPFNNIQSTQDGKIIFIPVFNNNRLVVFDARSGSLGSRASYGMGPSKILASPDGRWLAVINTISQNVAVLSLPEAVPAADIQLEGLDLTVDTTLAFSSDGRFLFIPSRATGEVILYDMSVRAIKTRVKVGGGPLALNLSPEKNVLASLDLGSNEASLIALDPKPIYFPHLIQSPTEYSGIALANFGSDVANVALIARDNTGAVLPGSTNPRILTVPPNQQTPAVTAQIFGFNPSDTLEGWIEAYTLGTGLSALYLSGTNSQTQLDGFLAISVVSKMLGFSRVTERVPMFGGQTSTEIILVNPSESTASLTFRLYGKTLEGPATLLSSLTRTLSGRSRLRSRLSALMTDVVYPRVYGYLEVTSDVPVLGLEVVRIGDSVAMLPAKVRGLPDTAFFSAQFATGGLGVLDTPIFSNVSFCNTSPDPIVVTAQITDDDGQIIPADSAPIVRTLKPFETLSGGADEIFGFPSPLSDPDLHVGSLRVTTDQPGLIGDVLFGDARNGAYLTSLDLQQQSGTKFGFAHYAQGNFGEPPKPLYTGLAMLNPNRVYVTLLIEAFTPGNVLVGSANVVLEPDKRLSRTIPELVPAVRQQNGGTIRISSDFPILVFEVFGSGLSEFLAAVPAIPLP